MQLRRGYPDTHSRFTCVDNMDHMVRFYSCKRKTRRWSYSLFMNMVDVISLNAYILQYIQNRSSKPKSLRISSRLISPQMQARQLQNPRLPRSLLSKIKLFIPETSNVRGGGDVSSDGVPNIRKRKRCTKCPSSR